MKKILKLTMIIMVVLIMLLSNISYATNAIMDALSNEENAEDDKFTEKALTELYDSSNENDIMLISDDIEIPTDFIDSDIFESSENISIENEINGNVYVIGKKVNISSEYITGNIFVIAEDVVIKGNVIGSIYVMGKNVTIETATVSSVYAVVDNFTLSENSNIMNDLNILSKNLNIKGNINRTLNAVIDNIDIAQTAEYIAKGNVTYKGACEGKTELLDTINLVKKEKDTRIEKNIAINKIQTEIVNIVTAGVIIAILYLIIRNKEIEKSDDYAKIIGSGILKGLLFLIVIPVVAFILICTIFGIPLAILVIAVYTISLYISIHVASLKIGEMIYNKTSVSNKAIIILYAICVYIITRVISIIPTIGGLINFLIVLYGFGSLMKLIFGSKKSNKKEDKEIVINEE